MWPSVSVELFLCVDFVICVNLPIIIDLIFDFVRDRFKTQANLQRHKEYHAGEQFSCRTCGRVYPSNSTLKQHEISHSNFRPHKCNICTKTFKRSQDLKFHTNQHTGAKPYKCPYCSKACKFHWHFFSPVGDFPMFFRIFIIRMIFRFTIFFFHFRHFFRFSWFFEMLIIFRIFRLFSPHSCQFRKLLFPSETCPFG